MAMRKGKMVKMINHGSGRVRLDFHVSTRGLIGIRTEIMTDTRGTAVMNSLLEGFVEWQGDIQRRTTGVLVADRAGDTTAYTLSHMEERGELFVGPGVAVYEGMIVGENARPADMDVNVTKAKKLPNLRASPADEPVFPARPGTAAAGVPDPLQGLSEHAHAGRHQPRRPRRRSTAARPSARLRRPASASLVRIWCRPQGQAAAVSHLPRASLFSGPAHGDSIQAGSVRV
jgi:hypothetical protein